LHGAEVALDGVAVAGDVLHRPASVAMFKPGQPGKATAPIRDMIMLHCNILSVY
jgi:hypothetical protein